MAKPLVLLLGGVDPSGCAGLAADLLTVQHLGGHALLVPTCNTIQNHTGLTHWGVVSADAIWSQFEAVAALGPIDAVKIGMIGSVETARVIAQILARLAQTSPHGKRLPVVWDPVLASSAGGLQLSTADQQAILTLLAPNVTVMSPNTQEALVLSGQATIEAAAQQLLHAGAQHCVVTGGDAQRALAVDYCQSSAYSFYLYQDKAEQGARGTGCAFAAAIATLLAQDSDVRDALVLAKAYVTRAIRRSSVQGPFRTLYHSSEAWRREDLPKLCYQSDAIGQSIHFPACPAQLGIYPVVDRPEWIERLLPLGIRTLQLRIKQASQPALVDAIAQAQNIAQAYPDCALFVNDHWQLAIDAGVYGVHLGQEDLHEANLQAIANAGLRLGVSTHSYWELARALAVNPSYIALGPIYATNSKQMPWQPQGLARLRQWVEMLAGTYPLVAIGGIDLARAEAVKATGVGAAAMISAITQAEDYASVTRALLTLWAEPSA